MRAHGHTKLSRQQQHGEHLVEAAQPAGVELAEADRLRLEQLLEHHTVLAMLTGGHLDRSDAARDRGVAEDVVGACRLLDPVRLELGQALHVGDRVPNLPDLVGVHHEAALVPDLLTHDPRATNVVLDPLADFHLHVRPAPSHRFATQRAQLLV